MKVVDITASMSREQQQQQQQQQQDTLEKASTVRQNFFANGREVDVNTDDYFISQERRIQNEKIKMLSKRKKGYKRYVVVIDKAKKLIQ